MNPFNTPTAKAWLQLNELIKACANHPDHLMKILPLYLKYSAAMTHLLNQQKVSATH